VSLLLAGWQFSRVSAELPSTAAVEPRDSGLNRRFARFAAVNYLMQVTTWVYDLQFVVFLSAATLGIGDVALLGFAYKFAKDFLAYVWTPLTGVMTPVLSRVHVRGEPRALPEAHAALTRIIWLVVLPAGVGLCVLTPGILTTLYPKYEGTGTLIVVFVAFTFGEALLSVPQNVLMVAEVYRPVVLARLVAFLTVPLVWFLLPRYGVLGVAVAAGSARLLSRALTMGVGLRRLQLFFPWGFAARVVSASVAMGGTVALALGAGLGPRPGYGRFLSVGTLGLWSLAGAGVFVVALKAVGGLHPDDRRRLASLPVSWARLLAKVL
jgi:O-antigen/teichoic acid export membrane protein